MTLTRASMGRGTRPAFESGRPECPGVILGLRLTNQPAAFVRLARVLGPRGCQAGVHGLRTGVCPGFLPELAADAARVVLPPPRTPRGPLNRPRPLWNTPGCETTSRWTALAGRPSARPAGRGDRPNLTRESAICTSGTPSFRPAPACRASRGAERPARLRTTSRRRERRRGWPASGRGKLSSAPRRCAFVRPARMTGPHGCTKCSPMLTAATCETTGTGGPYTVSWPAKIAPPRTRYSAPSTVSRRSPGIVDTSR